MNNKYAITVSIKLLFWAFLVLVSPDVSVGVEGPHNSVNSIGCDNCHDVSTSNPYFMPSWTVHPPQNIDDTQLNTLCWSCHNDIPVPYVKTHSSLQTGNKYGNWTIECWTCHDPHIQEQNILNGSTYGKLIRTQINLNKITGAVPPKTGSKTVTFLGPTGANSFADGDGVYDGICEVCHTKTKYFRNDGSGVEHFGAVAGTACTNCHSHKNGFSHGGSGVGCEECHGHDPGYGGVTGGKGTYQSHSTHTENDADDLKGPNLACSVCHDTSQFPVFADGQTTLAATTVCDACHSTGGTYDGLNDPTVGAKTNWKTSIYDHAGGNPSTLQPGKEKWCATCHDESPSQINGVNAPNIVGNETGAYTYGTGWGYYKTGHGLETTNSYASSGGYTYGAGKSCDNCHDYSTAHVDGNARTYSAAGSNYQAGYRLKSVGGSSPMTIPRPQNIDDHDPNRYALCLSCHDANKYLTKSTAASPKLITTSFRDDLDLGPWDGGDAPINIHEYHLALNTVSFDSDWDGSMDSKMTCVNCHNVHGSTQLSMIRDGSLIGKPAGMTMYYDVNMVAPTISSLTPPSPNSIPLSISTGTVFDAVSPDNICGNCHGGLWDKYYRSAPSAPTAPTLSWTGEAGYTTDGVAPNGGQGGDIFTFRIKYTDTNYQPPRSIQVWVDSDNSGTYDADEKHDMVMTDSNDVDVSDGKLYRAILPIDYNGANIITYRFYASDGKFDATGTPTHPTNNTISLTDNVPVLAWTGEEHYVADGVSPSSASSGSNFTFRVVYTDINNQCPASGSSNIQLWLDQNDTGDGSYEPGEKFNMIAVDAGDTNCTDGKLYTLTRPLSYAGNGSIYYRFYASDGTLNASGAPTSNRILTVTSANSAPVLTWSGETNFVNNGADPDIDVAGSNFTFRVKYSDIDNNSPSSIQVWVDKNDDGDYLDPGEKVDLSPVDGSDTDYTDGKLYTADMTLNIAGDGIINYRFYASDGVLDATGIPTQDNIVTLIIDALKVSCSGTGDYDYTSIQTAINNAADGDTILVNDGICTERITIDNKDLTIKSVNGAAVTIIDGSAGGKVVTFQNGADSTLIGLTIRNGNGSTSYGGGISISNSSPTIRDAIVTNNTSARAGGIYVATSGSTVTINNSTLSANTCSFEGGALYLASGASAVVSNTLFDNNTVSGGGGKGAAIYLNSSANAALTISGSTFTKNSASTYGGAIYASSSGGTVTVNISSSIFTASDTTDAGTIAATSNSSNNRGGVMYMTDSGGTFNLTISDSTIEYGHTTLEGGGMYLSNLDSTTISGSTFADNSGANGGFLQYTNSGGNSISFTDSIIRNNRATGNSQGAMYMAGGSISFDKCSITGNSAPDRGGAGTISGSATSPTTTTIQNSFVTGNKTNTFEGGGFWLTDDGSSSHTVNIINSTFSGNYAGTSGGGIHRTGTAAVTIINSILWNNGGGSLMDVDINGTVIASYSDIRTFGGYPGTNNVNIDPLFVNPVSSTSAPTSTGDYHLQIGSPCIDLGTSAGAPTHDLDNNIRPIGSGVDMGADEVVTVANNTPTLTWTSETNYVNDGVNPNTGAAGSSFEFRVNYTDSDDDAPSSIQVWIDKNDDGDYLDSGEKTNMSEVDAGDTNFTDGKLYSLSEILNYTGDGVLNYRFYAADGVSTATGQPTSNNTLIINTAPTLSWLGTGNYISDGVDPDSSSNGATFTFRSIYSDANNNPPTSIQVWVDKNDDGDYLDSGEEVTMSQVDPLDTIYSDGKEYSVAMPLYSAGDGTLNYRFYAADGLPATGAPTSNNTLTITNTVPILSWLGSGAYIADGVNPNGGLTGSNSFTFKVTYTDADNQCPVSGSSDIQVWIDKNDMGTYEPSEKFNMIEDDAGDTDCTNGKVYTLTVTNLLRVTDDYLNYRFYGSDGSAVATGTPATTDSTVSVFTANQAPYLEWTGELQYTTDGVNPDSGSDGDNFTFRVKYTDKENTAPSFIQVWVDINDNSVEDGGELTVLTEVDSGDTAYDDGKLYTATIALSSVTNTSTRYHFKASDGSNNASGPGTVDQLVTVLTPITVCPSGCDYTSIQVAILVASNGDFILVKDGTYSENINFNGKNLTIKSQNGSATTTIQGTGANAAVATFSTGETASAVLDGFTIDNAGNSSATRGLYISGASPTIKNSIIQGNSATNSTDGYGGGGVCIVNSTPTFANCTIRANVAGNRSGCGMYITGLAGGATITNSTIGGAVTGDGNRCTNGKGGGIYYTGSTTGALTIADSNIQYNQGLTDGGGIYLNAITNPTVISNTTILDNYTGLNGYGGGIHAYDAPLSITGGSISRNTSGSNRGGGGIYIYTTTGSINTITGSTINSNTTGSYGGGGIFMDGLTVLPTLSLSKVKIQGNSVTGSVGGGGGGGIRIAQGTANITNSLISGNRIVNNFNYGGGIRNAGTLNLNFSTIADNYAYDGGGLDAAGTENIYNSIIWGNAVAAGLTNTEIRGVADTLYLTESNGDTSFVLRSTANATTATTNGNYRLQTISNCIDTGDATNKPAGDDDIEGNIRPIDVTGKGDGINDYDKGTYEYME
jgi:predicted outer membrane repeat protein